MKDFFKIEIDYLLKVSLFYFFYCYFNLDGFFIFNKFLFIKINF